MRFPLLLTTLLIVALLLGGSPAAAGELSGTATLGFSMMRGDEGGRQVFDGHSFTQQYSVLYQTDGLLNRGRGGYYRLALGGEWNILDARINGLSTDIETTKLLYRGDVVIAPGGLPFNLHLYSHDMHRSTWEGGTGGESTILSPGLLYADINNGQRVKNGATLLIGIRNGSYGGRYRNILSNFPRLLMDYSEERVRDLNSRSKEHFRTRDLAFVSLNKKDNWYHFRYRDHEDYINPDANYSEKQHMLGTVDHKLVRRWINLTNWLKVSADGSYTVREDTGPVEDGAEVTDWRRTYDLNLFTTAARSKWRVANFTNFQRERTETSLEKSLEVPLFANGELDRSTAWRFQMVGSRLARQNVAGAAVSRDEFFAAGRIETFRQSRVVVSPSAALLAIDGYTGEGVGGQVGVELHTQNRYKPRISWLASYRLTVIDGTSAEGEDSGFVGNVFAGNLEMDVTPSVRVGLTEEFAFGHEDSGRFFMDGLPDVVRAGTDGGFGSFVRSTSTAFLEHSRRRLRNRFEVAYDFVSAADDTSHDIEATHRMNYEPSRRLKVDWQNVATVTRHAASGAPSAGLGTDTANSADSSLSTGLIVRYLPGRAWETTFRGEYGWQEDRETRFLVNQGLKYHIMKVNGIVRRLAELSEEITHERTRGISGDWRSVTNVKLAGNYYPTHVLFLGATLEADLDDAYGDEEYALHLKAGLKYQKLKFAMDYGYGSRSGDDLAKRKEHLFEVELTKTF